MSGIKLVDVELLLLLWVIPILALLFYYAAVKRRKTLEKFAEVKLLGKINTSVSNTRRNWKAAILVAAVCSGIFALSRPAWNPVPRVIEREGRDVVFILDVSKSMLAEDLVPSRLERSKLAIMDVASKLEGDRVGLIVFAGNAVVKTPLTLDYGFFRMMLEDVGPHSVSKGGTMIGDAIRKALSDVFDSQSTKFKDVILITDGEDHDSFPVDAAAEAGKQGIRLIAIGIGDENEGRRIPITGDDGVQRFLSYDGKEVWSRLDAETLRKMTAETQGGRYINVATGTIDLGDVYSKLILSAEKKDFESETVKRYEEKFQIFVGFMFLLLLLELIIPDRRRVLPQ